jgi:hypothetical protein
MEQDLIVEQQQSTRDISLPLYKCKGWLMFIGILSIIQGAFAAITIVGIIIAWLPIWMGVILCQASSLIQDAYTRDDKTALTNSLHKIKLYFIIMGVMTLIGIAFAVMYLIIVILFILFKAISNS